MISWSFYIVFWQLCSWPGEGNKTKWFVLSHCFTYLKCWVHWHSVHTVPIFLDFILSSICFNAASHLLPLPSCPLGLKRWYIKIHQSPDLQRDSSHWSQYIWKTLSKRCWVQAIVLWKGRIVNVFLLLEGSSYCQTLIFKWNSFYGKSFPLFHS